MNAAARNCFIWATILFFAALLLARFDSEIIDLLNRAIGPDNFETTKWVMQVDAQVRWLVETTAAVLIGAGVVIQVLAPRLAQRPLPEAGVDATA